MPFELVYLYAKTRQDIRVHALQVLNMMRCESVSRAYAIMSI